MKMNEVKILMGHIKTFRVVVMRERERGWGYFWWIYLVEIVKENLMDRVKLFSVMRGWDI